MRTVLVSRIFAPEPSAATQRLLALSRALAAHGPVTVLTVRPHHDAPRDDLIEGVRVRRWPVLRDRAGYVRGYLQYLSFDVPMFFRLLFTHRPSVVVVEPPPTSGLAVRLVCWVRRVPYVYFAPDIWSHAAAATGVPSVVVSVLRTAEAAAIRGASAVLAVSEEVAEQVHALGADPGRVTVVGNGVDTDLFRPDATLPAEAGRYFVYTGTMSEWQRPEIFVRAFALIADEFPDVALRFFGQGSFEAEVRRVAGEVMPSRVHFGGVVSPAQAASWLRGATASLVSIVPGIGYDFAKPTKTYASAACGTPVIFAGAGDGAAAVHRAGWGYVADFTEIAIADAMRAALAAADSGKTESLRAERSEWARTTASLGAVGERAAAAVRAVAR